MCSRFCGKCDLFDHISMEKMYPKEDNPNILVSDEMECFNIFKEKTKGKIYQSVRLELNEYNIDKEIEKENNQWRLSKQPHTQVIKDKRYRTGEKTVTTYTYTYNGETYNSLNEINKVGYYTKKTINFETILDLIPYYPYIVAVAGCSEDYEYIQISSNSYVDEIEERSLKYGHSDSICEYYRKELQNHYLEVIKKYNL